MYKLDERIYLLKYKQWDSNGGSFRYAINPTYTEHRLYYSRYERDNFIAKYLYLTGKDDMYFTDIECYFSEMKQINDDQMKKLIKSI